jgi:dipeptidyl aminopeptidase/acylaminoacyl peptidase
VPRTTEQIFTVDSTGANRRQLTTAGVNHFPSWSHDGRTIAFASNRSGSFDLYSMNPDGSDQMPVPVAHSGEKAVPRFSPDGSKLAFALIDPRIGHPEIWTSTPMPTLRIGRRRRAHGSPGDSLGFTPPGAVKLATFVPTTPASVSLRR